MITLSTKASSCDNGILNNRYCLIICSGLGLVFDLDGNLKFRLQADAFTSTGVCEGACRAHSSLVWVSKDGCDRGREILVVTNVPGTASIAGGQFMKKRGLLRFFNRFSGFFKRFQQSVWCCTI